jgi:hypothetical protein
MPPPPHQPGDPAPVLDVTGQGNPVLDAVTRLLNDQAPELLDSYWTVQTPPVAPTTTGTGLRMRLTPAPIRQLPQKLRSLLDVGSLESIIDVLLGPGLILHGIRSLPLANERVQIVLKAKRDPDNRGYAFLEHVDSINVSRYWFRLNTEGVSTAKETAQSTSISYGTTDAPNSAGHLQNFGFTPSLSASHTTSTSGTSSHTDAVRDTYFTAGPAERYTGDFGIDISITKTYVPSRFADGLGFTLPRRIAGAWQGTNTRVVPQPATRVLMTERVLIPSELLNDIPPPVRPGVAAVTEVPAGSTAASLGATPLHLTGDHILEHSVVNFGFDHAKLGILFDEAVSRFSGAVRPLNNQRSFAVGRLTDPGTRALDALRYSLSYNVFTRQLEFMLRNRGFDLPTLVRQGGAFTDTTGFLNIKVTLANPHVRGFTDGWMESVDYGFREFQQGRSVAHGLTAKINEATANIAGSTAPTPKDAINHQTHPGQGFGVSMASKTGDSSTATLKTMPRAVAANTKVPWERVSADAIVELTLTARNTRDLIDLPGGQITMAFHVTDAVELGVSPEVAVEHRLVHPQGVKVPSGIFVPAFGMEAHGIADDGLDAVRAAFALPETPGVFAIHVHVDGAGNFIVGDRLLTPQQFHAQVLADVDLTGKTLLLVTSHGDRTPVLAGPVSASGIGPVAPPSAAEGLMWVARQPVIASPGPAHVMPDGAVLAVDIPLRDVPAPPPVPGLPPVPVFPPEPVPSMRGLDRGQWILIYRDPANPLTVDRQALSHDLVEALAAAGFTFGTWPQFAPPPTGIFRR